MTGVLRSVVLLSLGVLLTACRPVEPSYEDRGAAYLTADERAVVGCYQSSAITDRSGNALIPTRLALSPLLREPETDAVGSRQVRTEAPIQQHRMGDWVVADRVVSLSWETTRLTLRPEASGLALIGRWSASGAQEGVVRLQRIACWPEAGVPNQWPRASAMETGYKHARALGFQCTDVECHVPLSVLLSRPEVFRGLRIATEGVALLDWEGSSIGTERGRIDLHMRYAVSPGSPLEGYHTVRLTGVFQPTPGGDAAGELADVSLHVVDESKSPPRTIH